MPFNFLKNALGSAARVSPTALYTAQVWQAHGRSVPELKSVKSELLHAALAPAMLLSKKLGGPTLTDFLLARHDLIDKRLHELIESNQVSQVIEIAAGLSPRGSRFIEQYGEDLTYIETDLPEMVANKRKLLAQRLSVCPNHRIEIMDAFAADGPHSLSAIADELDPDKGLVIITEGLLNYFDRGSVLQLWQRIANCLSTFQPGHYLSDIHFASHNDDVLSQAFAAALGAFVRGRVHLHFQNGAEVQAAMQSMGLACEVLNPADFAEELPSCASTGASLARILAAQAMNY